MRTLLRLSLAAVAGPLTALVLLAGCDSNAGVAARVGDQQISESDVSSYLTAQATPFTDSGQYVQPKVVVLTDLIRQEYARQLLSLTNGGQPSQADLQKAASTVLANENTTRDQLVGNYTQRGFTDSAADLAIRTNALFSILGDRVGSNAQQFLNQHKIPVSVDPRYGTWDPRTLGVSGTVQPGLPFLNLQSSYSPVAPSQ